MNRPERFRKSVDVLATAYLRDDLRAGRCGACAVGNLIAAENDSLGESWDNPGMGWHKDLMRFRGTDRRHIYDSDHFGLSDWLEEYTAEELHRIEATFEKRTPLVHREDFDYFDALMAVVDTLFEIHGVEDEDLRREAKAAFEPAAA